MRKFGLRVFLNVFMGLAALFVAAGILGCHSGASTVTTGPAPVSNQAGGDPADANMAPVVGGEPVAVAPAPVMGTQAQAPVQQSVAGPAPQAAPPAPAYDEPTAQGYAQLEQDADESEPVEYADAPPPPLPEYEQPEAPEPNYIWTPGYWAYAPTGYYWVPGVWCAPPYVGALWTPGWWGFYGGRYGWRPGYWGPHIGFYGGINYGYGYTGYGYYGGYWSGNNFYYNRSVNRINAARITNVYNRSVAVRNNTRVSFNGGRGGVAARPQAAEMAAMRGQRTPAMSAQRQHQREASQNRTQFFNQNRGRPGVTAVARPIAADRGIQRPVAGAARPAGQMGNRNVGANEQRPQGQVTRPGEPARQGQTGQMVRPENRPGQSQVRPEGRVAQPQNRPMQQARPVPQTRAIQPQVRPAQPAVRPTPQQRPMQESRPVQQPHSMARPMQQARPMVQRPQAPARPMQQARPQMQARPAPAARPQPQQHEGGRPEGRPR